jgi:hypothetical protein
MDLRLHPGFAPSARSSRRRSRRRLRAAHPVRAIRLQRRFDSRRSRHAAVANLGTARDARVSLKSGGGCRDDAWIACHAFDRRRGI